MKSAKTPKRMCIACRQMREKSQLIRFVLDSGAKPVVDKKNKAPGRGAYLCPQTDCLRKAIKSKALERGLDCQIPQEIYDQLLLRMEAGDHD